MDLLLQRKTLKEIRRIAEARPIFSVPDVNFMGALSDAEGNVLHLIPGQGFRYYERPKYQILTNFPPLSRAECRTRGWAGIASRLQSKCYRVFQRTSA